MIRNVLPVLGLLTFLFLPNILSAQFNVSVINHQTTRVSDFLVTNPPNNPGYFYHFGDGYCSWQKAPKHNYLDDGNFESQSRIVDAYSPTPPRIVVVPNPITYSGTGLGPGSSTGPHSMGGNFINLDQSWDAADGHQLVMVVSFTHPNNDINAAPIDGDIELHYDADLTLDSVFLHTNWADFTGIFPSGNPIFTDKVTWSFFNLQPNEVRYLYVEFIVPPGTSRKIRTRAEMTSDYIGQHCELGNCTFGRNRPMLRSDKPKDPNRMYVEEDCIRAETNIGQQLNYLVKFLNEGAGPSLDVLLEVYLDESVNIGDISIDSSSAPCTFSIDPTTGLLNILFTGINLPGLNQVYPQRYLPSQAEGYVAFNVCTDDFYASGEYIDGITDISFTAQNPVTTNPVATLVELSCPFAEICSDYNNGGNGDPGNTGGDGNNGGNGGDSFGGNNVDLILSSPVSIYPNPFTQELNIDYTVVQQEGANVSIRIVSSLGKEISQVLVDGSHAPGIYNQQFNLSDLPTGMYILVVEQNGQVDTRKLMKF